MNFYYIKMLTVTTFREVHTRTEKTIKELEKALCETYLIKELEINSIDDEKQQHFISINCNFFEV